MSELKKQVKSFKKETNRIQDDKVYLIVTRTLDILFVVLVSILTVPILILAGIIIKLDSKGPILYSQKRLGKDAIEFNIYKLRTMHVDAEKNGAMWASINDNRITSVGRILRRTRIDELPQLWNILKGDMTLVGPRPERYVFTIEFEKEIPGFIKRLVVKPGLTGWAQVNGGYENSAAEKLSYDLYYIENKSLLLYFKVILMTVKVVLTGEGAR